MTLFVAVVIVVVFLFLACLVVVVYGWLLLQRFEALVDDGYPPVSTRRIGGRRGRGGA